MRISIDHSTQYRFTEPQARVIQLLRLMPSDTQDQTVVAWRIDVDVDARLREATDGFGNAVTMLYAEGPVEALRISVSGEVLTLDGQGVVRGASEPQPPALYRRATPRTRAGAELIDFAQYAMDGADDVLDGLHRLNLALQDRFDYAPAERDQGWSASAAFLLERVGARDLAHMFIAAARGMALPARYVSGYRTRAGQQAECAPHAWAEAWIEGLGWVAFDPSAGICADEHYVRVAIGLDAAGAAPIVGHRIGAGEEVLDVDLNVDGFRAGE
jgi:transglutaminase-like putative cysteine protease